MKLIGLAGPARVGKDSIADYLVETHDFLKFAFSDGLYREVQEAYGLEDQSLLRGADTKEKDLRVLALHNCSDRAFAKVAVAALDAELHDFDDKYLYPEGLALSPRWVLQRWGTDYRRKQDPNYWVKQSQAFVDAFLAGVADGSVQRVNGLVNTTVRFENELEFIRGQGGEVWHVYRREAEAQHLNTYVSERRLPVSPGDKELYNNGTIEQLGTAATLLLTTSTQSVILEKPHVE